MSNQFRSLLDEAVDWLCVHSDVDKSKIGTCRQWCSQCSNYIRSMEEMTLPQRIRHALEQEK